MQVHGYRNPRYDQRGFFLAPFVGGLLGGFLGGAFSNPRPFYPYPPYYGPYPRPYQPYPFYPTQYGNPYY